MTVIHRLAILLVALTCLLAPGAAVASEGVHWGYEGETGPANWGTLSPDYAACGEGQEQSPVDIPVDAPTNTAGLKVNYEPSALTIVNNGHSVQVNYDPGSTIEVGGTSYALSQFHLHSLSEHTFAGDHTPMELHLVHKDANGRIAVIGVMLVEGSENPAYATVLANMPADEGEPETVAGVTVAAEALLPADRSYYRYNGSLTTPPCTEGVSWFVMAKPVELSASQIEAFQALYSDNYRPVQPMNGRKFLVLTDAGPAGLPATGGPQPVIAIVIGVIALAIGIGLATREWRASR